MSYPLEGLKVLDMSRVLAGPFAGRMLCDLGADVVKLEPPDGDITRIWGADIAGIRGYYAQQNAGKRNVSVDLSKPEGVEFARALAGKADMLVENFRPGVMARLGMDYQSLRADNPALLMLSISGFGADGPESQRAAYAPVIHAESGLIHRQAQRSGGEPADIALSIADTNASLHGLVGLLAALHMRQRTGLGQHIDMAMIDAMVATDDDLHYHLEESLDTKAGVPPIVETAAGQLLLSTDLRLLWKQLVKHFGVIDPTPDGADLETKIASRRAAMDEFFNVRCTDRQSVVDALATMNIPWGDVRQTADARTQPTLAHRQMITQVDDRAGGEREIVQSPYRFSGADSGVRGGAPHQGEHNAAVASEWLGLDEAGLARFQSALTQNQP